MTAAVVLALLCSGADSPKPAPAAREALQPFNVLVGSWKGSGAPEGTKEERAAGAWEETVAWTWKFKDRDAWLEVNFTKGRHFTKGELRYTPDKGASEPKFTLTLAAPDKTVATFTGSLTDKDKVLALTRTGGPATEEQRLVFSLLHSNRHLYRLETRPAGTTVAYSKKYQVGATKEGEPFANVAKGPECIVSGGVGSMKVTYKGKDYWVCCSGCRDEFKENPEKYIKEAEAKAKEKK
ncbi:MAG: YHS domain-containing protein [Gemmata sp.]